MGMFNNNKGDNMKTKKDNTKYYRVRLRKETIYEIVVPLAANTDYKEATHEAMELVCKYGEKVLKQIHGPILGPKPFEGPVEVK
tara:strand:+ start:55 stop:306 length:252 start_codon:yes stop_codon:yes gene_type:complete